jgi:hypothetical protein
MDEGGKGLDRHQARHRGVTRREGGLFGAARCRGADDGGGSGGARRGRRSKARPVAGRDEIPGEGTSHTDEDADDERPPHAKRIRLVEG